MPESKTETDAAALHIRYHLTDGVWHDGCGYCQRRRIHGGNGVDVVVLSPGATS